MDRRLQESQIEFERAIRRYFAAHRWLELRCTLCGRVFFSKAARSLCDDFECQGGFTFLQQPRPRRQCLVADLWKRTENFFSQRDIESRRLDDVRNSSGSTEFIVAAIQYYDRFVHGGEPPERGRYFIPQPVLRLKYLDAAGRRDGISTSFVNLCTAELDAGLVAFAAHLDLWLDYLSACGLFAGALTLSLDPEVLVFGPYRGRYLQFNYGGLELGEGIWYFDIDGLDCDLLDFGFGFERIVWAINKSESYHHGIGPLTEAARGNHVLIDTLRSLTLIATSTATPSHRGAGYHFRRLAKRAVPALMAGLDIESVVRHSHAYWSMFLTPPAAGDCVVAVMGEIYRNANRALCNELGVRPPEEQLAVHPDVFCEHLIRQGVRWERVRPLFIEAAHEHSRRGATANGPVD